MAVNNEHNPFCIAISYDYDKIKCKNKSNEKNNDPRNDKTINEIAYDTQHPEKTTDLHTVYGTGTHQMCWCYKCLRALISLIKLEQSYSRKAQKRTNSKTHQNSTNYKKKYKKNTLQKMKQKHRLTPS